MSIALYAALGAGGLLAAGAAGCLIGAKTLFNRVIPRQDDVRVDISEMADGKKWEVYIETIHREREKLLQRPSEHVTIKSADGLTLHGDFFPSENNPSGGETSSNAGKKTGMKSGMKAGMKTGTAILFHGYTSCGMNDCSTMAEYFAENGWNALVIDQRSHGKSEGSYIGFGILDRFDCLKWIEYITERLGKDENIILFGVSMGGATVLMASGLDNFPKSVKAIIADCAFTSPYDVFRHILRRDYHLPPHPIMDINDRISRKKAGYGFKDCSTLDAVKKAPCPILFIHGKEDTFVPTRMSEENYRACGGEKELLLVDNAGHAASMYENTELYKKTVTDFLSKYELF